MKPLRVFFPEYATEAHREPWQGAALVVALAECGIQCALHMDARCDAVLTATYWGDREAAHEYQRFPDVPVLYYCWDLYPFQVKVEHEDGEQTKRWAEYVEHLKRARGIFVPSRCTVDRVRQYTGRGAWVVKSSVRTFREPVTDGGYVLDPVRKYPDPNRWAVQEACQELRLPLVQSMNELPWAEYKKAVAGCRLVVSAQVEASTGGLSLLEGYALGKPVLLSDSPRHGGADYFGSRAHYFRHDDPADLRAKLQMLWDALPPRNVIAWRRWVETEYSEMAMARGIAERMREALG